MSAKGRMKKLAAQAAFILVLAAVAAVSVNFGLIGRFVRGEFSRSFMERDQYPAIRFIGTVEASDLLMVPGAAVFIDARNTSDFAKGHVPGALNVPHAAAATDVPASVLVLPRSGVIVVYCEGGDCGSSLNLARVLSELGFGDIRIVTGGWTEWIKAGLPVEPAS